MAEEIPSPHPADVRPDVLGEGLAKVLPRLQKHLSGRRRRVRGLEPDDLAQEVVARALRYRGSFDRTRDLWPWVRRLADRVICDQLAAAARRPDDDPSAKASEPAAPQAAATLDVREEVERILAPLAPQEREALRRFHQHGESVQAIARDMGLPEGTVRSHLSRARRRLAEGPTTRPEQGAGA